MIPRMISTVSAAAALLCVPVSATPDFSEVMRGVRPRGFGSVAYALTQPAGGGLHYYVATTGSDSNPGTRDLPFRTINQAAKIADAGDVVTIRDGIYDESVTVMGSGTAARPIVIQAENRGGAVLTGRDRVFEAAGWFGGKLASEPYVTLRGLIFRRYGALTVDARQGGGVRVSKGWIVEDCLFDEPGHVGLHIRSDSVLVTRSTFRNAYVHALVAWGPANRAKSPDDPAFTGISALRLTDLLIYANHTKGERQAAATASSVIKLMGTRGTLVDNIESYANNGPGLWFDTGNFDYVIRNSYFHDNAGRGVHLELSWGPALVENNVIADNQEEGLAISNSWGVEVRANLFVGNRECIRISDWVARSGRGQQYAVRDVSIQHNQFRDWAQHGCINPYGDRPDGLASARGIASSNIRLDSNLYHPVRSPYLSGFWTDSAWVDSLEKARAIGTETHGRVGPIRWPY